METLWRDLGFRRHLIVYLAVNTMLIVIDVMTGPQSVWFFWPLLGWGIGIFGHAMSVIRDGPNAASK
ncbi:MAG: 2TM domain-containing protein [Hyphomicrobiaceae bacterium]